MAKSLETPDKISRESSIVGEAESAFRFYVLYEKICRNDILRHAHALARANAGSPGVNGLAFAQIEAEGVGKWLAGLREELVSKTYRPQPLRRVMLPKPGGGQRPLGTPGGGQRPLGTPTIRDWVVQSAAKLVPEPIFEADFEDSAYRYRPRRSAREAVKEMHRLICRAIPTWETPICRNTSTRSRIRTSSNRWPTHCRPARAAADQAVAEGAGRRA
ncbi:MULTISPECIES: hypothetical protein [unclassified Mesorhizobium]|uniref:hypothetical protein n=1 Tax=unclassified Mesorhizobium TaxID=325217 RepID=UPI0033382A2A